MRRAPLRGERQRGASFPLDTRDALHRLYRLRAGEQAAEAGPFISCREGTVSIKATQM